MNKMSEQIVFSRGSFFHGTKADLETGDLITTGMKKNYNDQRKSAYVYFAGTLDAAIWGQNLQRATAGHESMLSSQQGILKTIQTLPIRNSPEIQQNHIVLSNL